MPPKDPRKVAAGKRAAETRARNLAARDAAAGRDTAGVGNSILIQQINHISATHRFHLRSRIDNDPSIPTTMNSLRRVPPELRQMIFHLSGAEKETLAAFRGDQVIYHDVLKVYWQTKRFTIPHSVDDPWKFSNSSLSEKSLNSMHKICIMIKFPERNDWTLTNAYGWKGWKCKLPPMKDLVSLKITDLRLQFFRQTRNVGGHPLQFPLDPAKILVRVRDSLAAFSDLRTFSCEVAKTEVLYGDFIAMNYSKMIDLLNEAFGLNAKLRSVSSGIVPDVYFWQSPDGNPLRLWNGRIQGQRREVSGGPGLPQWQEKKLNVENSPYSRRD